LKILVADDDAALCSHLEEVLTRWGYDVVVVRDGNEACRILLSDDAPKLAILDWKLPGLEGVEICRNVRAVAHEYTYIILLTAQHRDEDLVIGMESGSDDYITKPFKLNELRVRLRAGRRLVELQEELLAARKLFEEKATQDSLTGLLNHEAILASLDKELARSDRDGECVSVIMVDIDHFKAINDTYGHVAGDAVILAVASQMHVIMRTYDSIGRFGGDEFLIILPECCITSAAALAERLCLLVGSAGVDFAGMEIPVTISLGVAESSRNMLLDRTSLVGAADAALYFAKKRGRNRSEVLA